MSPKRHKFKILKTITLLRNQVAELYEHEHVQHPSKSLNDVELDIHDLAKEIERMELLK